MPTDTPAWLPWSRLVHLLALTAWFAAAFHLARLFNAHRAALRLWEPERGLLHARFVRMERHVLFGLAWPALGVLLVFGSLQLLRSPGLLASPFMHLKLGLSALLVVYQWMMHRVRARLGDASLGWSGPALWLFGQVPWVLLTAMLAAVVFRDRLGWAWGVLGLLALGTVIGLAVARSRTTAAGEAGGPDQRSE